MNLNLQYRINQDPRQHQFLRENSYWYKYLNRSELYYKDFIEDMKDKYKLKSSDRINKMMENTKGFVSFLIPCYNHERFAMDLFSSILDQSYEKYEIIVCDDCSRDQSVKVLQKVKSLFEEKGIRFELIINDDFSLTFLIIKSFHNLIHGNHGMCRETVLFLNFIESALFSAFSYFHTV